MITVHNVTTTQMSSCDKHLEFHCIPKNGPPHFQYCVTCVTFQAGKIQLLTLKFFWTIWAHLLHVLNTAVLFLVGKQLVILKFAYLVLFLKSNSTVELKNKITLHMCFFSVATRHLTPCKYWTLCNHVVITWTNDIPSTWKFQFVVWWTST